MTNRTAKRCIWAFLLIALALNWALGEEPETVNQTSEGCKNVQCYY